MQGASNIHFVSNHVQVNSTISKSLPSASLQSWCRPCDTAGPEPGASPQTGTAGTVVVAADPRVLARGCLTCDCYIMYSGSRMHARGMPDLSLLHHAQWLRNACKGGASPETATAGTVVAAGTRTVSTGLAAGVSFSNSSFRSCVVGLNTASLADGVSCRGHTQPCACHLVFFLADMAQALVGLMYEYSSNA